VGSIVEKQIRRVDRIFCERFKKIDETLGLDDWGLDILKRWPVLVAQLEVYGHPLSRLASLPTCVFR
jgi:hypothetical protein